MVGIYYIGYCMYALALQRFSKMKSWSSWPSILGDTILLRVGPNWTPMNYMLHVYKFTDIN